MSNPSLDWEGAPVPPDARAAVERLERIELSVEERKAALLELLASDSFVARCLALDFYCRALPDIRWRDVPLIEDALVEDAVRTAALRELAAPPYEHADPEAERRRGANHASALNALQHHANPTDAPLLARVLQECDDPSVLYQGVRAAGLVLRGEPAHPELVGVLSQIASRREVDPETRAGAIGAIGGMADESVTPLLVASLADPELRISVVAARCLLERDIVGHRSLVAPVAAAWPTPEFPPYVVHEVLELLGLVPRLADPDVGESAWAADRLLDLDFERCRPLVAPVAAGWPPADDALPWWVENVRRRLEGTADGDEEEAGRGEDDGDVEALG
jgi:hypothetical protein